MKMRVLLAIALALAFAPAVAQTPSGMCMPRDLLVARSQVLITQSPENFEVVELKDKKQIAIYMAEANETPPVIEPGDELFIFISRVSGNAYVHVLRGDQLCSGDIFFWEISNHNKAMKLVKGELA